MVYERRLGFPGDANNANSSDGGDNYSSQRCADNSVGLLFHVFFKLRRPVEGDPIAPGLANSVGLPPLSNPYCFLRRSSLSFQSFELQLELKLLLNDASFF